MAKQWTDAERRQLVLDFKSGSLSMHAFCRERGLVQSTMDRWVRLYDLQAASSTGVTLVKVTPEPASSSAAEEGLLVVVGDAAIEVHRGFDALLLREVVAALSEES